MSLKLHSLNKFFFFAETPNENDESAESKLENMLLNQDEPDTMESDHDMENLNSSSVFSRAGDMSCKISLSSQGFAEGSRLGSSNLPRLRSGCPN